MKILSKILILSLFVILYNYNTAYSIDPNKCIKDEETANFSDKVCCRGLLPVPNDQGFNCVLEKEVSEESDFKHITPTIAQASKNSIQISWKPKDSDLISVFKLNSNLKLLPLAIFSKTEEGYVSTSPQSNQEIIEFDQDGKLSFLDTNLLKGLENNIYLITAYNFDGHIVAESYYFNISLDKELPSILAKPTSEEDFLASRRIRQLLRTKLNFQGINKNSTIEEYHKHFNQLVLQKFKLISDDFADSIINSKLKDHDYNIRFTVDLDEPNKYTSRSFNMHSRDIPKLKSIAYGDYTHDPRRQVRDFEVVSPTCRFTHRKNFTPFNPTQVNENRVKATLQYFRDHTKVLGVNDPIATLTEKCLDETFDFNGLRTQVSRNHIEYIDSATVDKYADKISPKSFLELTSFAEEILKVEGIVDLKLHDIWIWHRKKKEKHYNYITVSLVPDFFSNQDVKLCEQRSAKEKVCRYARYELVISTSYRSNVPRMSVRLNNSVSSSNYKTLFMINKISKGGSK